MKKILCLIAVMTCLHNLNAQVEMRIVDRIIIDGTWMTRDVIILNELEFRPGDTIGADELDVAEKNLYDLGLFSKVEFSWEDEEDGSTTLRVMAKDQLHIMPLATIDGASNSIKLGASDGNFLGLNVDLRLAYEQEQEYTGYDFIKRSIGGVVRLPDTLLGGFEFYQKLETGITGNDEHAIETDVILPTGWFGGWEWSFAFEKSLNINYLGTDGIKDSGYSLDVWNVGTMLYPELIIDLYPYFGIGWISQQIGDKGLVDTGFTGDAGVSSFVNFKAGMTYGDIRTKNTYYQKHGWEVVAEYNLGIMTAGTSSSNSLFQRFLVGAEGHWLVFPWLEFAGYMDYAVTDSDSVSQLYDTRIHKTRDRAVPGLHLQGKTFYAATVDAHVTYIHTDWFALEHVSWFDVARSGYKMHDLVSAAPKIAAGTGLRFRIPNIPWLYVYVDVQWAMPDTGQNFWGLKI